MKRPLWLLLALLAVHFAIVLRHHARPLITDELYFVDKARYFLEHGKFPRAVAQEQDIVAGKVWGVSDYRPQGYPLFLAVVSGGRVLDDATLRLRTTIVQFLIVATLLVIVFLVFVRSTGDARAHWVAALLFGLAPLPLEFSNEFIAEAVTVVCAGTGLLLAWMWASTTRGARWLFFGTFAASLTLLLRSEMVATAPIVPAAALLLRREGRWRGAAAAAAAFALVVGVQVAYRVYFTGKLELFGAYRIHNSGGFVWTRTWLGTEKEAYDFIYAITEGRPEELPARAFADEHERAIVERAMRKAQESGYSEEINRTFHELAEKRRREHPFLVLFVRALNVVQLWIHLELTPAILQALTPVPRVVRWPILGTLNLVKVIVVVFGCIGGWRAFRRWRRGEADAYDLLTLILFAYVVWRTLLIGVGVQWRVHRYVVSAYIPMLWCAMRALSPMLARRSPSRVP